jgi:4-amino-4-deoxy-L-arabinose transferase-like glycosyltransferase
MATTVLDPAVPTGAARRAPWRSPVDQPAYARPALLVITVLAAALYAWGINHSQYHTFYANAARSMTESWKAFFYGSFDPGNSITLDKLPGFLWPQAISARIFGFHPWALTLPQVIEGVASLLVLYRIVRRWAGVNAALIASAAFLVTPVAVGLFRTAVEDPLFTLCVLLAAEATQRAAAAGRLRPLIMAGVWVGVGFQSKMLEAWAVLPALALVYLISAPITLRKRLAHIGLSAIVMAAVSCSWMLAVTLTPAKDRPYVDGTTNNSAFSMVVGYNFLNRFSSLGISAASTGSISATQGGGGHGGGQHGATGFPGAGQNGDGQSGAGQNGGQSGATAPGLPGTSGMRQHPGTGQRSAAGHNGSGAHHRQGGFGGASGSASAQGRNLGSGPASGSGQWAGGAAQHGAGQQSAAGHGGQQGGRGGGWGGDQNGWSKMFGSSLASQTGWLYPLAAIAIVCGLWWRRGKPRTDRIRIGFVLWGTWLATYFLVFSAGSVGGHTYYMGVIAVPLAALAGGGMTLLWRAYRAGGRRAWVLPGAVAATAAWGAYIASAFPTFLPWLAPAVGLLAVAAVVLLALARPGGVRSGGRLALAGLAASLAAMLLAPSAWVVQVFNPSYDSSGMGSVGPSGMGHGGGGHGQPKLAGGRMGQLPWGGAGGRGGARGGGWGGFGHSDGQLTAQQQKLLDYTTAHRGSAQYVFATTSWSAASPYIVAKGAEVLPLGGFTGQVPFPTLSQFQQLVDSGKLKYVLVSGSGRGIGAMFGNSAAGTTSTTRITNWVRSGCTRVPASAYGGTQSSAAAANGFPGPGMGETSAAQALYECGPAR